MTTSRFATAFTATAVVAAFAAGLAGVSLGHRAERPAVAPTVQSEWQPAITTPIAEPTGPVAERTVTRTIVVRESTPTQVTPMAGAPADARSETKAGNAHTVSTPDPTPSPVATAGPAVAAQSQPEPAPTTAPVPRSTNGTPTSMNGTPDPTLGGTTPSDDPSNGGGFVH